MSKRKNKNKITKEQLRKLERAAEREVRLENGEYRPTVVHKTSKKDKEDKTPNTVKDYE